MAQPFIGLDAKFDGVPGARTFVAPVATDYDIQATSATLVDSEDDVDGEVVERGFFSTKSPLETGVYFLGDSTVPFETPFGGRLIVSPLGRFYTYPYERNVFRDHGTQTSDALIRFSSVFDLALQNIRRFYSDGSIGLVARLGKEYSIVSIRLVSDRFLRAKPDVLILKCGLVLFKDKFVEDGMPWNLRKAQFAEECWIVKQYSLGIVLSRKVLVVATAMHGAIITTQGLPELEESDVGGFLLSCKDLALLGVLQGIHPMNRDELVFSAISPVIVRYMELKGFPAVDVPSRFVPVSGENPGLSKRNQTAIYRPTDLVRHGWSKLVGAKAPGLFRIDLNCIGFLAQEPQLVSIINANLKDFIGINRLNTMRQPASSSMQEALVGSFPSRSSYWEYSWGPMASEITMTSNYIKEGATSPLTYFEELFGFFEDHGAGPVFARLLRFKLNMANLISQ